MSACEVAEEESRQPHGGDCRGEQSHNVDDGDFVRSQLPAAPQEPKERVEEQNECSEGCQCDGRTKVESQIGSTNRVVRIRDARANSGTDRTTDRHTTQGNQGERL